MQRTLNDDVEEGREWANLLRDGSRNGDGRVEVASRVLAQGQRCKGIDESVHPGDVRGALLGCSVESLEVGGEHDDEPRSKKLSNECCQPRFVEREFRHFLQLRSASLFGATRSNMRQAN